SPVPTFRWTPRQDRRSKHQSPKDWPRSPGSATNPGAQSLAISAAARRGMFDQRSEPIAHPGPEDTRAAHPGRPCRSPQKAEHSSVDHTQFLFELWGEERLRETDGDPEIRAAETSKDGDCYANHF